MWQRGGVASLLCSLLSLPSLQGSWQGLQQVLTAFLFNGPLWMKMLCLHPSADSQVFENLTPPTVMMLGNRQVIMIHQAGAKRHG